MNDREALRVTLFMGGWWACVGFSAVVQQRAAVVAAWRHCEADIRSAPVKPAWLYAVLALPYQQGLPMVAGGRGPYDPFDRIPGCELSR